MTSIEYLDEQIQEHVISQDLVAQNLIIQISISDYLELKKQAKEMHKQEIKDAWDNGAYGAGEFMINIETSQEYYNQTFKKD